MLGSRPLLIFNDDALSATLQVIKNPSGDSQNPVSAVKSDKFATKLAFGTTS